MGAIRGTDILGPRMSPYQTCPFRTVPYAATPYTVGVWGKGGQGDPQHMVHDDTEGNLGPKKDTTHHVPV